MATIFTEQNHCGRLRDEWLWTFRAAVRALQQGGSAAFTPDGPRGPRREFKGGGVLAAFLARVPVVPVHAHAPRAWRLKSWDRMLIPKPFAKVRIAYGTVFNVPASDAEGRLPQGEAEARRSLNQAVHLAGGQSE